MKEKGLFEGECKGGEGCKCIRLSNFKTLKLDSL